MKCDEGDAGSRTHHRMDTGPLIGLHVEDLHRVEDLLAVEAADDVDLVVQSSRARVRALPVHGRYHFPLVPPRFISFTGAHPRATVVSTEGINLAALNKRQNNER